MRKFIRENCCSTFNRLQVTLKQRYSSNKYYFYSVLTLNIANLLVLHFPIPFFPNIFLLPSKVREEFNRDIQEVYDLRWARYKVVGETGGDWNSYISCRSMAKTFRWLYLTKHEILGTVCCSPYLPRSWTDVFLWEMLVLQYSNTLYDRMSYRLIFLYM